MSTRLPLALVGAAVAGLALVGVASVAQPDSGVSPLVVRIAELLLAGGAAYLLDDAAVALTTATPVGIWRRRLPTLVSGIVALGGSWALVLALLRWQDSLPPVGLASGELAVMSLLGLAAAAVLTRRGDAEPGGLVAPALGLLGLTAVLAEPVLRVTIFIPSDAPDAGGVRLAWLGVGALAALVLVRAAGDPARPGARRTRAARRAAPQLPGDQTKRTRVP